MFDLCKVLEIKKVSSFGELITSRIQALLRCEHTMAISFFQLKKKYMLPSGSMTNIYSPPTEWYKRSKDRK